MSAFRYIADNISPNREKIVYRGQRFSGLDAVRNISDLAAYLSCLGVKAGDIVTVALPNMPQAIFALYAAESMGAIVNLVSPKLGKEAFNKAAEGSKVLFLLPNARKKAKKIAAIKIFCGLTEYGALKIFPFLSPFFGTTFSHAIIAGRSLPRAEEKKDLDAPAFLLHSAGTTGEPKTVCLSARALNALVENVMVAARTVTDIHEEMGMAAVLPVFHGYGLGIAVHLAMRYMRCLPLPRFSAKKLINLMRSTSVSILAGVPSMFRKLLKDKDFGGGYLKNIELVFCGGDRLDPTVKEQFNAVLREYGSSAVVMEGYGMSETASVVTINTARAENNSVGQPLSGVEIEVVDGEICLRSESLMLGYYEGGKIVPCTKTYQGKEYFPTGDIGEMREGDLYLFDRKKRTIKIGGNNVFPKQTEEIALTLPTVLDAVAVRTTYQGKPAIKLLVVTEKAPGQSFETELKNRIEKGSSRYNVPRIIERVKEIKKTAMGKNDYRYYEEQER